MEMRMKMPLLMGGAIGGALVKSHRVRKGYVEQTVVAGGDAFQNFRQAIALDFGQSADVCDVAFGDDHRLEWPYGPEGNHRKEVLVLFDHANGGVHLQLRVIA